MWLTGMMSVHGVELLELNIPSDTGSGRAPPVLHTTKPLCAYVCMVEPYKFTFIRLDQQHTNATVPRSYPC